MRLFERAITDHEARNELEQKVLGAREGRINSDELLKVLLDAQVFMPVQDEKAPALSVQRSTRAQPLVLSSEEGTPILVLFSNPERAKPFLRDYSGFSGGILEPFRWALQYLGSGCGIMLNPDSDVGFDMEPETVRDLVRRLAQPEIQH